MPTSGSRHVTQLIALHLTKYYDPPLESYIDCMSAMAQTNKSLRTYKDKICTKDTGLLTSSMHELTSVTAPQ
jgi:hypothetical protein